MKQLSAFGDERLNLRRLANGPVHGVSELIKELSGLTANVPRTGTLSMALDTAGSLMEKCA